MPRAFGFLSWWPTYLPVLYCTITCGNAASSKHINKPIIPPSLFQLVLACWDARLGSDETGYTTSAWRGGQTPSKGWASLVQETPVQGWGSHQSLAVDHLGCVCGSQGNAYICIFTAELGLELLGESLWNTCSYIRINRLVGEGQNSSSNVCRTRRRIRPDGWVTSRNSTVLYCTVLLVQEAVFRKRDWLPTYNNIDVRMWWNWYF